MKQQNTDKILPLVLVYCRVSTDKQEEKGTSLDSQAAACIEFAKENGYHVAEVVKEVYSGAYLFDRPLLNEQRAKLRNGEYGAVIAYAVDRLSRDVAHLAILSDEIERHGAELHFVTEQLDQTAEGKLMLSVKAYVGEVERIKIRERCVRGRLTKLKSGKMVAHSCDLYGYTVDRQAALRLIKPEEAEVVGRIFRDYTNNFSIREIARNLNNEKVPPPSAGKKNFKHEKFKTINEYGVNVWGVSTIGKILQNEAYTGVTYQNQYGQRTVFKDGLRKIERFMKPREEWIEIPDATPAIVTRQTFWAAQNRKSNTASIFTRNGQRPVLLRGLVFCKCGRALYPEFNNGRKPGQTFLSFRCASRGKMPCPHYLETRVSGIRLDAAVWGKVSAFLSNPNAIRLEMRQRQNSSGDERANIEADIKATKAALAKVQNEIEKLTKRIALVDDVVFDLVNKQITDNSKEQQRLEAVLAEAESRVKSFDSDLTAFASLIELATYLPEEIETANFEQRRLWCDALGIKVTVLDKQGASGTMAIPNDAEVINLVSSEYEDLRHNNADKRSYAGISGRPGNGDKCSKINSKWRPGKPNRDAVLCSRIYAR